MPKAGVLNGPPQRVDQDVDDGLLERSAEIGPVLCKQAGPLGLRKLVEVIQYGRFQTAERKIVSFQARAWEGYEVRIALAGQPVDFRSTRIAQSQQAGHLVEGLAGCVVARTSQQRMPEAFLDAHELGVAAGDNQAQVGKRRRGRFDEDRVDMAFQMVDPDQRTSQPQRKGFGKAQTHQQRADQPRSVGDGDSVEVAGRQAGFLQGLTHDRDDSSLMIARGQLGHHAPIAQVRSLLGGDYVGTQFALDDHGRGRVVARCFDPENGAGLGDHGSIGCRAFRVERHATERERFPEGNNCANVPFLTMTVGSCTL